MMYVFMHALISNSFLTACKVTFIDNYTTHCSVCSYEDEMKALTL